MKFKQNFKQIYPCAHFYLKTLKSILRFKQKAFVALAMMDFILKFKAFLVSKALCVLRIKSLNFRLV